MRASRGRRVCFAMESLISFGCMFPPGFRWLLGGLRGKGRTVAAATHVPAVKDVVVWLVATDTELLGAGCGHRCLLEGDVILLHGSTLARISLEGTYCTINIEANKL